MLLASYSWVPPSLKGGWVGARFFPLILPRMSRVSSAAIRIPVYMYV